jgi:hypothetical protein
MPSPPDEGRKFDMPWLPKDLGDRTGGQAVCLCVDDDTVCVWYTQGADFNFVAELKDAPPGKRTVTYRFRHFRDDKVHGSKDERSWYVLQTEDSAAETRGTIEAMVSLVFKGAGLEVERLDRPPEERGDDGAGIMARMAARPWAHMDRVRWGADK